MEVGERNWHILNAPGGFRHKASWVYICHPPMHLYDYHAYYKRHLEAVYEGGMPSWKHEMFRHTMILRSKYWFNILILPFIYMYTPCIMSYTCQKTAHLLVLGSLQWGRKHQCDPLVNRAVSSLLQALVVCSVLAFPRSTSLSRSATLKGEKEHELFLNSTTWREKITRKTNSPIGSMYGIFTYSCHTFKPYMDPMGQDSNTGNFWQPSYQTSFSRWPKQPEVVELHPSPPLRPNEAAT